MDSVSSPWDVFAVIGVLSASWVTFKFTRSLWYGIRTYLLATKFGLSADLSSFGEWAVVTGATDGIGKAYAQQLAEIGLNIVLISRSTNKLEKVAAEIEKAYNVQTRIITADFTEAEGIYDDIEAKLDGLQVGILVNNVGMMQSENAKFADIENVKKFISDTLHCNCLAMTMMIQICLPQMAKRKKGVIVNISSSAGASPVPYATVYSASKAYVDFISRGLHHEYCDDGIIVQSILPFYVKTKFVSSIEKASWLTPEPSTFVKGTLNTIGVEIRTPGFVSHSLQGYLAGSLPEFLMLRLKLALFKPRT